MPWGLDISDVFTFSKNISKDERTSYASAEHTYERHEMIKIIFPSIDASAEHLYEQHQKKIDNLRLSQLMMYDAAFCWTRTQ